jgi:hypothetical protein
MPKEEIGGKRRCDHPNKGMKRKKGIGQQRVKERKEEGEGGED